MFDGVEVDLDELDHAGRKLEGAAQALSRLHLAPDQPDLGIALPGALSASSALAAALRMDAAIALYSGRLTEVSEATHACAASYRECDESARAAFIALLDRWPAS